MRKKVWNDSVWSKVIAQGIIEFIRNNIWPVGVTISSIVVSYFVGWWPKIISLALSEIRIEIWQLIILCFFTLWKLSGLLLRLKQKYDAWKYYKKDTINGIVWRWDYYISGNLDKESVCGYCPCCDREIAFSGFGGLISEPVTLECKHCDIVFKKLPKLMSGRNPIQKYRNNIFIEIERMIRVKRGI